MGYTLRQGDCLEVLKTLPAASVHCVVTSPPYWGLRDYGVVGQLGMEPTLGEYIANMVAVFREVRRVLRDDGTLWLNLGDAYANDGKRGGETGGKQSYLPDSDRQRVGREKRTTGLPPKNLIGIPWRVAFALQADGWYLRSDIIWHKPNPMPESVTDRPTKAHEYLFLLAKSERYFYDSEAIKEPAQFREGQAATFERTGAVSQHVLPGQTAAQHRQNRGKAGKNAFRGAGRERQGAKGPANREGIELTSVGYGQTRNKRSVWTVAIRPYKEAHFATYPVELIQPCIKAGTSAHGCCSVCGAPWVRVVEREGMTKRELMYARGESAYAAVNGNALNYEGGHDVPERTSTTIGWSPSCTCAADVVPCTVLDPFSGAGTTGVAAIGLGRNYIGLELNPDYLAMSDRRLRNTQPALIAAD